MNALYLLQFACLIFMLVNAALLAMSRLHIRWESIYNIEATHTRRRHMVIVSTALYAVILLFCVIGYQHSGSEHIGWWLYVMLLFYAASVVYDVVMISSEMKKRKKMLETMAANDILPYVRYSRMSLILLFLAALVMPFAILSTTLLIIVGPMVLCAVLFFTITFISLGINYVPTESLLDEEAERIVAEEYDKTRIFGGRVWKPSHRLMRLWKRRIHRYLLLSPKSDKPSSKRNSNSGAMAMAIKTVLSICLLCRMMRQFPDYNNDIISAECGFSFRTYLYRNFKEKTGKTPTEWRNGVS